MVPRLCRYKWHSSGLKARILGEVFYCPCSKRAVCRPGHTAPSTVATWAKKRRGAAEQRYRRRPPFLKRCSSLRAWCTQTTCDPAAHARWRRSQAASRPAGHAHRRGNTQTCRRGPTNRHSPESHGFFSPLRIMTDSSSDFFKILKVSI